jgi:hypothetical protein
MHEILLVFHQLSRKNVGLRNDPITSYEIQSDFSRSENSWQTYKENSTVPCSISEKSWHLIRKVSQYFCRRRRPHWWWLFKIVLFRKSNQLFWKKAKSFDFLGWQHLCKRFSFIAKRKFFQTCKNSTLPCSLSSKKVSSHTILEIFSNFAAEGGHAS